MKNIIEIKNLVKKYDNFTLGELSLDIPSGCIIGLIGENGAGKTTLIKCLLGIIKKDQGEIKIFGKSNYLNDDIGVVLDNMFFPEILKPQEIVKIMQGIYQNWDTELFNNYLKEFELPTNKPIKELSKGMRKKLEIAVSLSHHPKLLILDEPTSGLDPVVRSEVLDLFLEFIQDEDKSIILSTHITSDLEHIADKIIFIDKGKIVLNEMRDDIIDDYGILKCSQEEFKNIKKEDVIRYKQNKYNYEVLVKNKKEIKKKYKKMIIDNITLEELMVLMIKGEA